MGGIKMEVIFEYEIDGRIYSENEPPKEFIDDLLNALKPFLIPQK